MLAIFLLPKILVTAGPTQEPIDPVRFITNHSSGKMGYAITKAAKDKNNEQTKHETKKYFILNFPLPTK